MKLFRFQTFTTTYYFPKIDKSKQYLYGLYSAYGGKLSKIYWWLFQHSVIIRNITAVDSSKVTFDYEKINYLLGGNSIMSFNMGSPGDLQKISILGYNTLEKKPFFAKYSVKPKAIELTKNEISIYQQLSGNDLVPKLYNFGINEEYVWLKTEYIKGKRIEKPNLSEKVFHLCLNLSKYHLNNKRIKDGHNLQLCLSHGDFCPWNMLVCDEHIKLIDWEQAKDRPLGFDLFTYITQITNLIYPEMTLDMAIKNHKVYIKRYFDKYGIKDWHPYLKAFAIETKAFKEMKGSLEIAARYDCLL